MQFVHGRYAGQADRDVYFFVVRFDEELGIISGEVYPRPPDDPDNPADRPHQEFSTAVALTDSERAATATVAPDGLTLTLVFGTASLVFIKSGSSTETLHVDYRSEEHRFGEVLIFEAEAILHLQSRSLFRTIRLEIDSQMGLDTTALLQGHPLRNRQITLPECYATAGVEVVVDASSKFREPQGLGETWSSAELEQALVSQFDDFDRGAAPPSWRAYMLIATAYADENHVRGYMFDQHGRRASAVFAKTIADEGDTVLTPYGLRLIRTAVHELGHSLNLLHAGEAGADTQHGFEALSFMNRPEKHPEGVTHYWKHFQFDFDPGEKRHLRHAAQTDLLFGHPYRGASTSDQFDVPAAATESRAAGFTLELRVRPKREEIPLFEFGEPVHLEAQLSYRGQKPVWIQNTLDPSFGELQVLIRKPDGRGEWFRPYGLRCAGDHRVKLGPRRRQLHADLFLGYGADGFPFMTPGLYVVTASWESAAGSVHAPPLRLWVRYPDREIEKLVVPLFDDRFGRFLAVGGGPHLERAYRLHEQLISTPVGKKHPAALAFVARDVVQSARGFKRLQGGRIYPRKPKVKVKDIQAILASPLAHRVQRIVSQLPNFLFLRVAATLWKALAGAGEKKEAAGVKHHTLAYLRQQNLRPDTEAQLQKQHFHLG